MKNLFIIPLALLVLALPALAQENATGMTPPPPPLLGQTAPTQTNQLPKPEFRPQTGSTTPPGAYTPPKDQRPLMGSSTRPMMPMREGGASSTMPRPMDPNGRPFGSSTMPNMPARPEFPPGFSSTTRPNFFPPRETFSSTTKQAILERRDGFASTTKAIIMERRATFASSTAAKIMDMRENKEERKEHFASTTALKKAEITEDVKARILGHAEHAAELMDAMLGRLASIAERINARIDILSAEGVETTLAEAELAEAYDAIDAADAAINAAKAEIAAALESENPKEMLGNAKSAGEGAKAALRAAHEALREAAEALPKPPEPVADNS